MNAGLNLILAASAALFAVGAFAVIARRSALLMLIGTQFMFVAGCIAFVAFARFGLGAVNATSGAAVAVFAGTTAVTELAVGLSMAALIYREHRSLAVDADRG
jgi:NADH-quinone oxidoreductase subunit K/NAD(P)H-quinone oxidoreductase subunit 4L